MNIMRNPNHYKYMAVVIAFFIMLIVYGIYYSFGIFFKPVLDEFGWSRAETSGAFSLSWIMQGFFSIVMGWLNDKLGPRVVLSVAGILVGAGLLLTSQIHSVWQFYLYYGIIIGVGLSGVVVPLLSTVAKWFTVRRSLMTGIAATGVGVGILIGPPVVNKLVLAYDWRVSYLILGGFLLVVVVLISQWLKRPAPSTRLTSDEVSKVSTPGDMANVQGFTLKEAIKTGQFWIVFAIFICLAYCIYTTLVHLVPHITDIGFSAGLAANVLSVVGAINVAGCLLLGGGADKIGVKRVYILGMALVALGYFWLPSIREAPYLFVYAVIFGFAVGGCCASQSIVVANLFGLKSHGIIFGIMNAGYCLAAAGSPLLAGYIFDVSASYNLAFILSGGVACIGLVLTILIKVPRGETAKSIKAPLTPAVNP
jgi:MFS family permease